MPKDNSPKARCDGFMATFVEQSNKSVHFNMITEGNLRYQNARSPFNGHKILNHIESIKEFLQESKRYEIAPITIEIHPTNRCNLRCRDCTFQNINRKTEFDSAGLEKITKGIIGLNTVKAIVWSGGGEPTLYKGLIDSARLFGEAGIEQGIATNGTNLTDEFIDVATKYFTYVRVSLNAATRQSYVKMHGTDQYWNVRSGMEKLREKRDGTRDCKLTVGSSFLVYPENVQDIPLAIKNAEEMGLDYLQIKPAILSQEAPSLEYLCEAYRLLSNLSLDSARTTIMVDMDKFQDLRSNDYGRSYSTCWGALFYATISADQKMYVCCHKIGDKNCPFGNLREKSFQEIWWSGRKKEVLQSVDVSQCPPNCKFHKMNKVLQDIYDSQFAGHKNFL